MRLNKIKTFLQIIIFIPVIFFSGCNDDIFYRISVELEMIEPRIKGSPTNIVVFNDKVFVASGKTLFSYGKIDNEETKWSKEKLDMKIMQLAATDNYLYALCFRDEDDRVIRKLQKRDADGVWENAPVIADKFNTIQTIYSANNKIYIGAQNTETNEYAVHVINEENNFETPVFTGRSSAILTGVAYNGQTFISTMSGIFLENGDETPIPDSSSFVGIITLPDNTTVVAVKRGGDLYRIILNEDKDENESESEDGNEEESEKKTYKVEKITGFGNSNRDANGTLAIWKQGTDYLLLAGRQDNSYTTYSGHTFGYVELKLTVTGELALSVDEETKEIKSENSFKEPGAEQPSTVDDNQQFSSSMGKTPVNSLFQTPENIDPEMTLFASTQKEGLWSCRIRKKARSWNAEE